jgi:hypothetical protein
MHATYDLATVELPADAVWSSSFGQPGQGGFAEYWHTPAGARFVIRNGPWDALRPFAWTCEPVDAPAERPRDRAGIRAALDARDALRKQPAQQALDVGGFGTRTQPSLF